MIFYQVQPPEEVITNFEAIQEWLIFIGIGVAVLVGIVTLIGIGLSTVRKHKRANG